jgi:hypothetical protein
MNIEILIAAFLFSLPFIGRKIEKKYDLIFKEQVKQAEEAAKKLSKQLAALTADAKDINLKPSKDAKWN